MSKIAVIYWSGTGNTEAMADLVVNAATAAGAAVDKFTAAEFNVASAGDYTGFALGCPAMGAEQLEESEFEPRLPVPAWSSSPSWRTVAPTATLRLPALPLVPRWPTLDILHIHHT